VEGKEEYLALEVLNFLAQCRVAHAVILATQGAKIRRIVV
jgi:hypothetical protein